MPSPRNPWVRLSSMLYGWIVRAYPREFREEFGAQMLESFTDRAQMSFKQRGAWGLAEVFLMALLESPARLYTEYTEPKKPRSVLMSEIEAGKKVWYRREIWKTHSHIEAFVTGVSVTAQFCGALVLLHFFGEQPEFYWLAISLFAVLPIELYIFFEHFTPKKKVAHA